MGQFSKPALILIILFSLMANLAFGQNYRDQKKLIRLKPNNLMVIGQIETAEGEPISDATISLFDPSAAKIKETIPVDDLGEYLFTLEKGKSFGLIVEKEGYFPYYTQFVVPYDKVEEWENPIKLPEGLENQYELYYDYGATDPSNKEVLESLIESLEKFPYLSVWAPGEPDSIFQLRTARIRNSFLESGLQSYRLLTGEEPGDPEKYIHLKIISNARPPDAGEDNQSENSEAAQNISADKWTLQFIASKNELNASDLKGVSDYKVYKGKDGYYRYTYGVYNSKEDVSSGKSYLRSKGFSQSFAKKIEDLQKL